MESVKPKTLFEKEKQIQELYHLSYKHIRKEYLVEAARASLQLTALDGNILEECSVIFFEHFLTQRENVVSLMSQAIEKLLQSKQDTFLTPEEIAIKNDPFLVLLFNSFIIDADHSGGIYYFTHKITLNDKHSKKSALCLFLLELYLRYLIFENF